MSEFDQALTSMAKLLMTYKQTIEQLRERVERVDDLLEIIDRPVPKDGLLAWRYDIHVARSRISDGEQK